MKRKHSEETKKIISQKRKEWLKNNPDSHPWRKGNKFKSKPCENVKKFLKSLNINFIEEHDPEIENRFFSIDIALPDKMVAIEINGNQHYERDGRLKPYYQERHDLLKSKGWDVFEIHYSHCFQFDKWQSFTQNLQSSEIKKDFDYLSYIPRIKIENICIDCNSKIFKTSLRCRSCQLKTINDLGQTRTDKDSLEASNDIPFITRSKKKNFNKTNLCKCGIMKIHSSLECSKCHLLRRRKVERPTKEELEKLIFELPFTKLSEKFGVSDVAIKKWCKQYGITNFPPRGFFITKERGQK